MQNNNNIVEGRRNKVLTCLTGYSSNVALLATALLLLINIAPVFYSCTKYDEQKKHNIEMSGDLAGNILKSRTISFTSSCSVRTLDLFIFNDDKFRMLDSYMRAYSPNTNGIQSASCSGDKILFALANCKVDSTALMGLNSYSELTKLYAELEDEAPSDPVMTYECQFDAASDTYCIAALEPVLAEVVLNSISCNFSDRPYKGKKLENVRVYLTNVCSRYPIAGQSSTGPEGIINYGQMNQDEIEGLSDPGILHRELDIPIGAEIIYPDIKLYCFPNTAEYEDLGTRFTRLVIEGTIDGVKTFYPININRNKEGVGIERNTSYSYDIRITRRGVNSPDQPIEIEEFECSLHISDWNIKSRRTITY